MFTFLPGATGGCVCFLSQRQESSSYFGENPPSQTIYLGDRPQTPVRLLSDILIEHINLYVFISSPLTFPQSPLSAPIAVIGLNDADCKVLHHGQCKWQSWHPRSKRNQPPQQSADWWEGREGRSRQAMTKQRWEKGGRGICFKWWWWEVVGWYVQEYEGVRERRMKKKKKRERQKVKIWELWESEQAEQGDAKGWDGICSKAGAKANVQLSRTFVLFKKHISVCAELVSVHKHNGCRCKHARKTRFFFRMLRDQS